MKITWFAGQTVRIHIGGQIVVTEPRSFLAGVDGEELLAGADRRIELDNQALAPLDTKNWRKRRPQRLIDEADTGPGLDVWRLGERCVMIEAPEEPQVIICDVRHGQDWGRWADGSVVMLCGPVGNCAVEGRGLLDMARPRLIALACPDEQPGDAIEALRPLLAGAALLVLEAGLAVEV